MKVEKNFYFSMQELFSHPEILLEKRITQLRLCDRNFLCDKKKLLKFIQKLNDVKWNGKTSFPYITFEINMEIIDKDSVDMFLQIPCGLQLEFLQDYLNGQRKIFARKIALLNKAGLVFGFDVCSNEFATIKLFKSCIDEICNYYPNHVYIDNESLAPSEKLSTQDIKNIKRLSFSFEIFYSYGRAVPWFLAVLQPLRIKSSSFFSDFAEWQECNNCGLNSSFDCEAAEHEDIEKMQLSFLKLKYEEKKAEHIFAAVKDLVCIHGSFSRCSCENTQSIIELSYHPDDILSPYAMDLQNFAEQVCLEPCKVKIFSDSDGPHIEFIE
ncbi:MAG: hypothetical protein ACTTHG_03105 [Treponemataceae bacterium]